MLPKRDIKRLQRMFNWDVEQKLKYYNHPKITGKNVLRDCLKNFEYIQLVHKRPRNEDQSKGSVPVKECDLFANMDKSSSNEESSIQDMDSQPSSKITTTKKKKTPPPKKPNPLNSKNGRCSWTRDHFEKYAPRPDSAVVATPHLEEMSRWWKCKYCETVYDTGSTSAMAKHLKTKHKITQPPKEPKPKVSVKLYSHSLFRNLCSCFCQYSLVLLSINSSVNLAEKLAVQPTKKGWKSIQKWLFNYAEIRRRR